MVIAMTNDKTSLCFLCVLQFNDGYLSFVSLFLDACIWVSELCVKLYIAFAILLLIRVAANTIGLYQISFVRTISLDSFVIHFVIICC